MSMMISLFCLYLTKKKERFGQRYFDAQAKILRCIPGDNTARKSFRRVDKSSTGNCKSPPFFRLNFQLRRSETMAMTPLNNNYFMTSFLRHHNTGIRPKSTVSTHRNVAELTNNYRCSYVDSRVWSLSIHRHHI